MVWLMVFLRVQRGERVLEDDLHVRSLLSHLFFVSVCACPRPSNRTSPPVGSSSRRIARPVVDLPQPDSPTTPSVLPFVDA